MVALSLTTLVSGVVAQAFEVPRITGMMTPGSTLTVDESAIVAEGFTVASRVWVVDGVDQGSETATTYDTALLSAGAMVRVKSTLNNAQERLSPPFMLMDATGREADDGAMMALGSDKFAQTSMDNVAIADGDFLDPTIWSKQTVPAEGESWHVPAMTSVDYTQATSPRYDCVLIEGTLTDSTAQATQYLWETMIIGRMGHWVIGGGFGDRMPAANGTEVIISGRDYTLSPNADSDIDFARDPWLASRSIMWMGTLTVFGMERTRHVKTSVRPMATDTTLTFDAVPADWEVGDEILITGTATDENSGTHTNYDERRTITALDATTVTFAAGLLYDHGTHNVLVTDAEFQPTIANITHNVTFRSEVTANRSRRGHMMAMNENAITDVWDCLILEMGRTATSLASGTISPVGTFNYAESQGAGSNATLENEPATATSNIKGRYPFHFHFNGFDRADSVQINNCTIDGAPGWGLVHHGCEADITSCTVTRWAGAGIVAETGDEVGPWANNLSCGCESDHASYTFIKLYEDGGVGRQGDVFRQGIAYAFRGRAVKTVGNVAASCPMGYGFYHRNYGDGVSAQIPVQRANTDVKDIAPIKRDFLGEIDVPDHPISHFTGNEAYGVYAGIELTKESPDQGHDIMTQLVDFKAWACVLGMGPEYIGNYIILRPKLAATNWTFTPAQNPGIEDTGIGLYANVAQFSIVDADINGFANGIYLNGNDNANTGVNNDIFSATNPRFIISDATIANATTDINYQTEAGQTNTTETVTQILDSAGVDGPVPATTPLEPEINLPLIVFDWNGSQTFTEANFSNLQTGTKVDKAGTTDLPKNWDSVSIKPGAGTGAALFAYAAQNGYYTHNGDNIIVWHGYFSDRLDARPVRVAHAARHTGTIPGGWTNNGEWTVSANAPIVSDLSVNVVTNTAETFNVLTGFDDLDTGPASLRLTSSFDGVVYFGPDKGKLDLNAATGEITYTPFRNFKGTDEAYVWVTDEEGYSETVRIEFIVADAIVGTVPVILAFGQSNTGPNPIRRYIQNNGYPDVRVLNVSEGAAGVANDGAPWNVETDDSVPELGSAYVSATATIDQYLIDNPTHYIAAAYSSQGEADTGNSSGTHFQDAAIALNTALRNHVGTNFPIWQFTLSVWQTFYNSTNLQEIRTQQFAVGTNMTDVTVIDSDVAFAADGITQADAMRTSEAPNYIHYKDAAQDVRAQALLDDPAFIAAIDP